MKLSRKFPQTNYQLYIGVVIGLMFSLFLNEMFWGSVKIWKVSESSDVSKVFSQENSTSKVDNLDLKVENETGSNINRVRVICWVLTYPNNHRTKAIHVKRTWGKRCDKLLFISSAIDSVIDSVAIPGAQDGREWLWGKTKGALKYIWDNYKDEFDWILKADDDTYVIVENLRKFLASYSPTDPIFFGCQFHSNEIKQWVSGGAEYVLSKGALRKFVLEGLPNSSMCNPQNDGAEDAELAKCLRRIGAILKDSRDSLGRHRFLVFTPPDHLFPRTLEQKDRDYWYLRILRYPQVQGMDCCANDAITYHYISPREMYVFEYFLYHIRADGVEREQKYVQDYPLEYTDPTTTTVTPLTSTTPATTTTTKSVHYKLISHNVSCKNRNKNER